ncbi:uncharacterized protein LOC135097462 isoform X2 [Scylla paramamosain]|uniref:uncharacterized protein LOC135097462 isoform X2 n=1 Tax=Scylla paramamosain TaxID=85552 RepID=UPI003083139C
MLLRPSLSIQRDPQVLVVESCLDSVDGKQSGFQSKVVVIHGQDTREDALQLASQLRNPMEGNRLYVLLLQESKKNTQVKSSLRCDPWNSIHKWFIKVDAVLPVLSPQLLRQIQNRDFSRESEWEKRYNCFAHSMMLDQHVEYGSKNGFCRAVCPARFPEERCLRSDAFTHAVFTTMEECPHFQDLTVKRFLKTLLEHNRRDILSKLEKFVRLS